MKSRSRQARLGSIIVQLILLGLVLQRRRWFHIQLDVVPLRWPRRRHRPALAARIKQLSRPTLLCGPSPLRIPSRPAPHFGENPSTRSSSAHDPQRSFSPLSRAPQCYSDARIGMRW